MAKTTKRTKKPKLSKKQRAEINWLKSNYETTVLMKKFLTEFTKSKGKIRQSKSDLSPSEYMLCEQLFNQMMNE